MQPREDDGAAVRSPQKMTSCQEKREREKWSAADMSPDSGAVLTPDAREENRPIYRPSEI
jgi:hypothetical protein